MAQKIRIKLKSYDHNLVDKSAEKIAKTVAAPMRLISRIVYPFVWLLVNTTTLIMRLFRVKTDDSQVTEEEIKALEASFKGGE